MEISKVDASVFACCTSWPAGIFGVTAPKPMPYRTISSPGWAGREVRPAIAPSGRTYVPSANSATTYWKPPILNDGGDRKSTRLNSSHLGISYAVFCFKKKKSHQPGQIHEQLQTAHRRKYRRPQSA